MSLSDAVARIAVAVACVALPGCGIQAPTSPALTAANDLGEVKKASVEGRRFNHAPTIEIVSVGVFRGGHVVDLSRPYRMRVGEHASILVRWSDPDGDQTWETSRHAGVEGIYVMGLPLGHGPELYQFDSYVPSQNGVARISALVVVPSGRTGRDSVVIHVSNHH